jgi:hypothetical protein
MCPSHPSASGLRCDVDEACDRAPCFRVTALDQRGACLPELAMDACGDHHGDAAQVLARTVRDRGIAGGFLQVSAIAVRVLPAADKTIPAGSAAEVTSFPFARIPVDRFQLDPVLAVTVRSPGARLWQWRDLRCIG